MRRDLSIISIAIEQEAILPAIRQIRLANVKIFERVSSAAVGTLLQITVGALNAEVCLRAARGGPGGTSLGVVLLEGTGAGAFVTDGDLNDCFAIDLTNLAEIVLSDPAPRAVGAHQSDPGNIYEASDRSGTVFLGMAVKLPTANRIGGYVRLTDPRRGHIEQILNWFYLGKAAVIDSPQKSERILRDAPLGG